MEKQEEEEKLRSAKLSTENDPQRQKTPLPAKLAPALLTSYANFTCNLESPDFAASISLSGNGVVHEAKNTSHFQVGIDKKTHFASSTRSSFTPKDPEKYRLRSQFGEFSTLTSTIGATSNFTLSKLNTLIRDSSPQDNFKIAPLQIFGRQDGGQRPFSK